MKFYSLTLILKLDLVIVKTYQFAEAPSFSSSKVIAERIDTQGHRQTGLN